MTLRSIFARLRLTSSHVVKKHLAKVMFFRTKIHINSATWCPSTSECNSFSAETCRHVVSRQTLQEPAQAKTIWTNAWLKQCSKLSLYDTLLKELASEQQKDFYNFMRMDEEFFNEILANVSPRITRKPKNFRPHCCLACCFQWPSGNF